MSQTTERKSIISFGSNADVTDSRVVKIQDTLPPGIWKVQLTQSGFTLVNTADRFDLPDRIFGSLQKSVDRVKKTYANRCSHRNTGVLADGIKGAGKSLMCNMICNDMIDEGIAVIVCDFQTNDHGPSLNDYAAYLGSIPGKVVYYFDEFGKNFDAEDQTAFLSLLDGGTKRNGLFLFTTNPGDAVNDFLKSRPGRVHYKFSFETMDADMVEDYVAAMLTADIDHAQALSEIKVVANLCQGFTMDMLTAIVEEVNLFNSPVREIIDYLNIVPGGSSAGYTMVQSYIIMGDKRIFVDDDWVSDPTNSTTRIDLGDYLAEHPTLKSFPEKLIINGGHLVGPHRDEKTGNVGMMYESAPNNAGDKLRVMRIPDARGTAKSPWANAFNEGN